MSVTACVTARVNRAQGTHRPPLTEPKVHDSHDRFGQVNTPTPIGIELGPSLDRATSRLSSTATQLPPRSTVLHEHLRPRARLVVPDDSQIDAVRLPSDQYPSDHLSLVATFDYRFDT